MENATQQESFEQWAIVELMGHVRMAGKVTEEKRFGVELGRIDIYEQDGTVVTQYFGGGSVYRITPTTEEIARKIGVRTPAPIQPWELRDREPALPPAGALASDDYDPDYDADDSDPYADE